jgi:DNA-binding IclR family transcriptional regulator
MVDTVLVGERPAKTRGAAVPAVERAVRVLRALGADDRPWSLSDLSRELGISKSTLSTLLATLEQLDLVVRDPASRAFRLGPGLLDLSRPLLRRLDAAEVVRPYLDPLQATSGETAVLHVPERDGATVIVERVEPIHRLKVVAPLGHRLPPFAGSVGKVLLAALPPEEAEARVRAQPLPSFTPRTIVDPDAYLAEIRRTRARGYALEHGEYLVGVRAVSAPVLDHHGRTIATLSVVGVSARLANKMSETAREVVAAAAAASRDLGAPGEGRWQ